jgi:hypothetical protein
LIVTVAALVAACGAPLLGRMAYLPWSWRDDIPPPGRCRIAQQPLVDREHRDCDDIEWAADPGESILYRPSAETHQVVVCYMDPIERGLIDGVEVFDMDSGRLLEVIQRHGEPPPEGGCQNALWQWLERLEGSGAA